jgi:hypothetical protein
MGGGLPQSVPEDLEVSAASAALDDLGFNVDDGSSTAIVSNPSNEIKVRRCAISADVANFGPLGDAITDGE